MKLVVVAALGIGCVAADARADLPGDVERLKAEWKDYGKLQAFRPRLLERGDVRPLLLPAPIINPTTESCTTLAVIGSPSTNFVLRFVGNAKGELRWPNGEWPEVAVAGAAQLVRCGARKAMLGRLVVEMRSPRAVLEVVAVEAAVPLPSLRRTLPHRDPGPVAPPSSGGPAPLSAPLEQRASAVEGKNRREGALEVRRRRIDTGDDGTSELALRLEPGCHRFDALGLPPPIAAGRPIDVDLELFSIATGELWGQDRTESADATLSRCVGEPTAARLRFSGSLPAMPIVLLSARWALPQGVRELWGVEVSARMAEAIWRSHNRSLKGSPVYESIGAGGLTALPIEVEPGACYLAAVAPIRGDTSGMALAVQVGKQHGQNNSGPESSGTTLAFCNEVESRGLLEVETRGSGVAWLIAVWQTGQLPVGQVQE
jgi:hypothetical protein